MSSRVAIIGLMLAASLAGTAVILARDPTARPLSARNNYSPKRLPAR
jgi:hypothetical protein